MVAAAVIKQTGKVEVHQMPDVPPPYLRMMRPTKITVAQMYAEDASALDTLDISTVRLGFHRLVGLSVTIGYWPDSWQDDWAIEELLRWEGREDEIRRNKYYADFIVNGKTQQANSNERRQIESQSVPRDGEGPAVLVLRESVRERDMDSGRDVTRGSGSEGLLRLERTVSGGHAPDLSTEDGG